MDFSFFCKRAVNRKNCALSSSASKNVNNWRHRDENAFPEGNMEQHSEPKKQPFIHFCERTSDHKESSWILVPFIVWEFSFIRLISLVSESRIGVLGSVSCARSHRMVKRKGVAALREKVLYLSLVLILEGFGCYLETGPAWPFHCWN